MVGMTLCNDLHSKDVAVMQVYADMDLLQLTSVLHTYAKLQLLPGTEGFMKQLLSRFTGQLSTMPSPRYTSDLAWSLGQLQLKGNSLIPGVFCTA